MMSVYVPASTANPTGFRPWNSRLGYYAANPFPLPTTGQGPFLLQPGVMATPAQAGGLSAFNPRARYLTGPTFQKRLGQTEIFGIEVDPTLLALGIVALIAAVYLFGGGRPKRKARRLRRRISKAQTQLRAIEAV